MNKNPLLSIIVPVFNTKEFINRMVYSLQDNLGSIQYEIIIVDDGSSDGSAELCDTLAKENGRIKVFHKENGGVASARNLGIEMALGQFIMFLDSDDYVNANINSVIEKINESDLLVTNAIIVNNGVEKEKCWIKKEKLFKNNELHKFIKESLDNSVCNKIFKLDIIKSNNLHFENYRNAEDMLFVLNYMKHVKDVYAIPISYYFYDIRSGSAMTAMNPQKILDAISACNDAYKSAEECDRRIKIALEKFISRTAFFTLKMYSRLEQKCKKDVVETFRQNKKIFKRISNLKTMIVKVSLMLFGFRITLNLLEKFIKE